VSPEWSVAYPTKTHLKALESCFALILVRSVTYAIRPKGCRQSRIRFGLTSSPMRHAVYGSILSPARGNVFPSLVIHRIISLGPKEALGLQREACAVHSSKSPVFARCETPFHDTIHLRHIGCNHFQRCSAHTF
jgi:hypothetical protein